MVKKTTRRTIKIPSIGFWFLIEKHTVKKNEKAGGEDSPFDSRGSEKLDSKRQTFYESLFITKRKTRLLKSDFLF
ncbi:hypothetical protein CCA_00594 [Chlamydia caviae GPIC]|uniref:Uncharacterized protein n=1 Tax=Chlamydia caviae (strain ATCC VR-813 / DSM 19441 / 03DC25 / GPIC) TaxID=227941 RepID=Q822T5_CHLCV|nr:hypothetical protein CCA_00594 [Chlamydia caviae GPIC]